MRNYAIPWRIMNLIPAQIKGMECRVLFKGKLKGTFQIRDAFIFLTDYKLDYVYSNKFHQKAA